MSSSDDKKASDNIKDSAQQIWLAGLGAFAKAQQEGAKAFEALVKEGAGMQKRTQAAAEESLNQAQSRLAGFASEFGARAADQWGKLEGIFEERVARALRKLGVPSAEEVAALEARIEALEAALKRAKAPARKSSARQPAPDAPARPSRRRSTARRDDQG